MVHPLPNSFRDRRVGEYLDALASGSPTPGGGSAAGLTGAMGCSLGAMVCRLKLARAENPALNELVQQLTVLSDQLLELARQDELVFATYRDATALPRGTDAEKATRHEAIERALVGAAEVPLRMVDAAVEGLGLLEQAAEMGSSHALGDVVTGGYLIHAMALGSLENIDANVASMKDAENREQLQRAANDARAALEAALTSLTDAVAKRRT